MNYKNKHFCRLKKTLFWLIQTITRPIQIFAQKVHEINRFHPNFEVSTKKITTSRFYIDFLKEVIFDLIFFFIFRCKFFFTCFCFHKKATQNEFFKLISNDSHRINRRFFIKKTIFFNHFLKISQKKSQIVEIKLIFCRVLIIFVIFRRFL